MNVNKNWKINLLNLNYNSIVILLKFLKEKKFNSAQITNWVYKKNIIDIDLMTNIKSTLKKKLKNISEIKLLNIKKEYIDTDNTIKWLIETNHNNIIETVAIPNNKNHFTLCISSQIGCMLNCSFCLTGKNGFTRNLKTHEIISQVLLADSKIKTLFPEKKITNIVMMGMGEPLLNIENVLSFISTISNENCYNINKKKITISTSGITSKINIIAKHKIPLALSLHATNDKIRSKLMPINKKYPIKKLLTACQEYSMDNDLTIEYIMLENINDSKTDAFNLIKLLKNIKCKICLIPFNEIPYTTFNSTKLEKIITFQKILKKNSIITTIRKKRGSQINAACGQLSGLFKDKTERKH